MNKKIECDPNMNDQYPLLEISENGKYRLYINEYTRVLPESEGEFEKIIKNKKVKVIFTHSLKIQKRLEKLSGWRCLS